uniref:Osmotin-like protein n=1 Tax=Aegilops tauschii subsp. strangulata TaxID=200361 RepID=A0A453FWA4_AEGTS
PATLAQVSLHHGGDDQSSYGVSVVDGFNVGLSVTPHEGRGNCPVLACRPSRYSDFFKSECPQAFTYAHDSPSLTHQCSAPRELKVIFCH